MGHNISGLIARAETLAGLGGKFRDQPTAPLAQGLAFMPLDDRNLDDIVGLGVTYEPDEFLYLSRELADLLRAASRGCALAYVETDYFGGAGDQGAIAFRDGDIIFGPERGGIGPINGALAALGVAVAAGHADAFDAAGLTHLRHQDEFWPESGEDEA